MATSKDFEHTIPFRRVTTRPGEIFWLPVVTVELVQANGRKFRLPLLFDTGASTTTLRHDLYPLVGASSWDEGAPEEFSTAGGADPVRGYRYNAKLEFLGQSLECPIVLQVLPTNPLWVGLLGREGFFQHFGFGFWESNHELHVTATP